MKLVAENQRWTCFSFGNVSPALSPFHRLVKQHSPAKAGFQRSRMARTELPGNAPGWRVTDQYCLREAQAPLSPLRQASLRSSSALPVSLAKPSPFAYMIARASIADVFHVRVDTLCIDLSEEGAAGRVASWARSLAEPVEVLICNAGMFFMEYLCPENLGKVRSMMVLHMESVAELCILRGSDMISRGRGRILIMSSITDRIPAPGIAVYSATKSFLSSFGKSLFSRVNIYFGAESVGYLDCVEPLIERHGIDSKGNTGYRN